ncbi:hypothetical protein M8J76_001183 [Diaphorina citri]|nr:hypothetical protein M8J75_014296 [Diaphorina citri]KAI5744319.1 hypothetical protein M8J76_001183 [Diaphorina citri]KAI5753029.1 hypothetical protein M8J77_022882 [Diaphorina citri]
MVAIKTCWSPCIVHNNVKDGSIAVAGYTIAASVVSITLTIYAMNGGDSSQLYSPFFEADVRSSLYYYGLMTVAFFVFMIFSAVGIIYGIQQELRGFLLPWLIGMGIIVLFQTVWPIWLMYAYYIYIQVFFFTIIYWLWAAYNYYCWLCVYSQYMIIYKMQSPNIELLYP